MHQSNERLAVKPVSRTLAIERAHEICFSKVPVPKCSRHTMATSYEKGDVQVVYACMDRSNPQVLTVYSLFCLHPTPPHLLFSDSSHAIPYRPRIICVCSGSTTRMSSSTCVS